MSYRSYLHQEDRRLLGLLGVLALILCVDAKHRMWPSTDSAEASPYQPSEQRLNAPRPSTTDLNDLLRLLSPPEPKPQVVDLQEKPMPEVDEERQEGLLAELFVDRHRFRLRACFNRSGEAPFAAMEKMDAESLTRTLKRVEAGNFLGPYKVESVNAKSINLSGPGNRGIELKLFEADLRRILDERT